MKPAVTDVVYSDGRYRVTATGTARAPLHRLLDLHRTAEGAAAFRDVGTYLAFDTTPGGEVYRSTHPGGLVVVSEIQSRAGRATVSFHGESRHVALDGTWVFHAAAEGTRVELRQTVVPKHALGWLPLRGLLERRSRRVVEDHCAI